MADSAEKYLQDAAKSANTLGAPSAIDAWLDNLMRSPIDRRGPLFGVPPVPPTVLPPAAAPTRSDADPYHYGRMRIGMLPTDPWHSIVAPLEHKEFVREVVGRNPTMAVPMAGAIPAYTWMKHLGLLPTGPNTSPASWDEIFAGYEGLLGGLRDQWPRTK